MKEILALTVVFVACVAVSDDDCNSRWNRWLQYPLPPPPIPGGTRRYFLDGNQFFVLTLSQLNGISLSCQGKSPDPMLLNCLNVSHMFGIGLRNCKLSNFNFGDFLHDQTTAFLQIVYDETSPPLTDTHLSISDLPTMVNITISGFRSLGLFNVTFARLPNIYLLNITDHNFTTFHDRPFRLLYRLQGLSLRSGIIETLQEDLFYGLENLRFLDLAWNRIETLSPSVFSQLMRLLDLDVAGNKIDHLPAEMFSRLTSLATFHIQNNRLTSLPFGLFQYLPNLIYLFMDGNLAIKTIPGEFLKGAQTLEKFTAMNCSLTDLEDTLFSDTMYLTFVALSVNRIRTLPTELFNATENLIHLFLDDNEISHLPSKVFHRLFRLNMLSIAYNKLYSLDSNVFEGLSSLTYLDVSYNRIASIEDNAFEPLVNLKELHMTNNPLSALPLRDPLVPSRYLLKVSFKNCQLEKLPKLDWIESNLTSVDFSYNRIWKATLPIYSKHPIQVFLQNNRISTIALNFAN